MKYKPGDEVLIKAKIVNVNKKFDRPYWAELNASGENWVSEDKIIPMDKTYSDGLKDAWELARKLYCEHNNSERREILGIAQYETVLECMTPEEALAKIEAYEKEKEIKVENVVEDNEGTKALVIDEATENTCFVFTENGCVEEWYKRDLKKTGKKIPISGLLRQIGE